MENRQPISSARFSSRVGGSRRSGRELISTAVPLSRHAVNTFSASNFDSGRMPRPPVDEPAGAVAEHVGVRVLDTALIMRRVIDGASIDSLECTLATTTSSRSSSSGS